MCRFSTTHTTKEAAEAMVQAYAGQGVTMTAAYCSKCKRWHVSKGGAK